MAAKRDYTKYKVEGLGENLNKRKLVFTVVKDYVEKNNPSFQDLQKAFPDEVQGFWRVSNFVFNRKFST